MNFWIILLSVIILSVLYFLYITLYYDVSLVKESDLNSSITAIPATNLFNPGSANYTYELWIYVNKLPPQASTKILEKGDTTPASTGATAKPESSEFKLYLPQVNVPKLNVLLSTNDIIITDNMPLQKWTYLSISVQSGQFVDCYIDGKLIKSVKLKDPVAPSSTTGISFGSLDATLVGLKFVPNASDPQTVWSNYLKGNGISAASTRYGLNLSLLKDNVEQKKWSLF